MVDTKSAWDAKPTWDVVPENEEGATPRLDRSQRGPFLLRVGVGYAVLTIVMFGAGFMLTYVLDASVGHWDQSANEWLASRRTSFWDDITGLATAAVNTMPVIAAAIGLTVLLGFRHRWREATFVVLALTLEVAVFLSVTFAVGRPRPDVIRLNATPTTDSFPSGHAAAATVLLIGITIVVFSFTGKRAVRALCLATAILFICLVAFGRVYRGMHHPTDVGVGVLLGLACLCVSGYATAALWPHSSFRNDSTGGTTNRLSLSRGEAGDNRRSGRSFGQDAPGRADPAA